MEHVIKVAGIDYIGIGGDLDGVGALPVGLEDASTYPALLAEMMRRGYSEEDIKKMAGLNVLRVMRENERIAARLQSERPASDARFEDFESQPVTEDHSD